MNTLGESLIRTLIADGCEVDGNLEFSILFSGVKIGKDAEINSSIIMPGAVIEEGAKVLYSIVAENAHIGKGAVVGGRPEDYPDRDQWGVAVIGAGLNIADGAVVAPKAMIEADVEV